MRLLDLFCSAGGAAKGYADAGFEVVGVDIEPQPNYPFEFIQADALEFPLDGFDAVHASPPCQAYSVASKNWNGRASQHPDLVGPLRHRLFIVGVPYVIENVPGAPLLDPIRLCGSSFGLDLRRHRLFESNLDLKGRPCDHSWQAPRFPEPDKRRGGRLASVVNVSGHAHHAGERELRRRAMQIDWMTDKQIVEAIPPAYTRFIGQQLMAHLTTERQAA
jgi:DNA (cytosine-5)-methyltransferase 1